MGIRQFNVQYSLPEDRLLLRFSTDDDCEYPLWFTRFITRGFIVNILTLVSMHRPPETQVVSPSPVAPESIPRREGAEQYQSASNSPLGNVPVLVTEVRVTLVEGPSIRMDFGLLSGEQMTVVLPQLTVEAMVATLQEIQANIGWELRFDVLAPPDASEPTSTPPKATDLH